MLLSCMRRARRQLRPRSGLSYTGVNPSSRQSFPPRVYKKKAVENLSLSRNNSTSITTGLPASLPLIAKGSGTKMESSELSCLFPPGILWVCHRNHGGIKCCVIHGIILLGSPVALICFIYDVSGKAFLEIRSCMKQITGYVL